MKLLKFGGKSLANGKGIKNVIAILSEKIKNKEKIIVVLSARGDATDELENLLELAKSNCNYEKVLIQFRKQQIEPLTTLNVDQEFDLLNRLLKGVQLTEDYSQKIKDLVLAQGELLAVKMVSALLNNINIKCQVVDSRLFLKTDDNFGNAQVNLVTSKEKTVKYIETIDADVTPIITGFIASNITNETTTLGRNGTNYSASLIANFLGIKAIESYTHVDGIFTANPEIVSNAKIIKHINYNEASELASFGTSILHTKSINPLIEDGISLHILNTFNKENEGTLISNHQTARSIKSISVQEEVVLINIIGKGIIGKKGIDARIFSNLSNIGVNIGIISQGSSERGVSFIIPKKNKAMAQKVLLNEFKHEILKQDIQAVNTIEDISVVTIVGQHIGNFASCLDYLKQNKINILLINNTISGNNISLVIHKKEVKKAVNVIHSQIFGAIKTMHIAIVGKGTVGGSLINQLLVSKAKVLNRKNLKLNIFAIAGKEKILFNKNGISDNWRTSLQEKENTLDHEKAIIAYARKHHLENLVLIDNTSSEDFVNYYTSFIENGFDLVSSNKIANTQRYFQYKTLRESLQLHKKNYLYETNVGAGLPIIDTIRTLHESGENITRIKGVFSGSLSYLFNSFSASEQPFSYFLKKAIELGYTEPDPREDLCGNDVARKLLILARELDLKNEFNDINIENLIPESLRKGDTKQFLVNIEGIDTYYSAIKNKLADDYVLRYIGDLSGNLQEEKGDLQVKLVAIPKNSALGNLTGSDSIFEIYTESYKENPITIIGAGAGAEVTARGVFGDLLRIADKK
ncbi:bifunctional aspartate kinase/homoserine dehydrogenase I [Putridiphycobacter roseus]|uniref:Bifunctional aspartate kinase/homoserine dehydrogenase I n=1 Tax=Putridiphycobacter roseus TaxID=2219161 RepID=A0A2W1N1G6_9FLAO|nr:bifunctional aspartate kinase/homoserine dehydrogenase I [Putridiphycobacter roseus]PZE17400.1 bifunctional aspartate kinase/homoserine dehydrogenase I [Putridiphycobacter roseus]